VSATNEILRLEDVRKHFPTRSGKVVRAVDGVSLAVRRGETLGLVGESGSGKSTVARAALFLAPPTAGRVLFEGTDLAVVTPGTLQRFRRRMQIIFQDPSASLNPRMTVGTQVAEGLRIHGIGTPRDRKAEAARLLDLVGVGAEFMPAYPHEFSGGQQQRIGIARALAVKPELLVCDEPVSSLDVSIQAQIINLLMDLQRDLGLTYLLISHNLAVVEQISHRVAVMYLA
jgi:ABC-type glutathione transport system ATPase component